jgi:hypothetical protein
MGDVGDWGGSSGWGVQDVGRFVELIGTAVAGVRRITPPGPTSTTRI